VLGSGNQIAKPCVSRFSTSYEKFFMCFIGNFPISAGCQKTTLGIKMFFDSIFQL